MSVPGALSIRLLVLLIAALIPIVVGCSSNTDSSTTHTPTFTIGETATSATSIATSQVISSPTIQIEPSVEQSTEIVPSQLPTQLADSTPTVTPQRTVVPVVVPSPTVSAIVLTVVATVVPAPTETPAPTPTPTEISPAASATVSPVNPTIIPVLTPTIILPTATSAPAAPTSVPPTSPIVFGTPDPRYGLVLTSDLTHLSVLGALKFLDLSTRITSGPSGEKRYVFVNSVAPVQHKFILDAAAESSGRTWYVLGEPNASGMNAADVIVGLHDTYAAIRAADPQAKITSPSILNFDYQCDNTCGGYQSGHSWAEEFLDGYISLYGTGPDIDYWAIDLYPIRWDSSDPVTDDSSFLKSDLAALRKFLDDSATESQKPIVITELGIHWGFESVSFIEPGCTGWYPSGAYAETRVKNYLRDVFTWLEQNMNSLDILEWYLFSTFRDLDICQLDSGYGLTLFDGSEVGASLTAVGSFYYDWVRGVRP